MSGGISAIRGFDYQSTVILDLLFEHFGNHGPNASVRPEGTDDLDLRWTENNVHHCRFVQVKKPSEDTHGYLNPLPWSLPRIVRDLLPGTLARLIGNDDEQTWVLGDTVNNSVRRLVSSGPQAPLQATNAYWDVIHRLSSTAAQAFTAGSSAAVAAPRWRVPSSLPSDPVLALTALTIAANAFGQRHGTQGEQFAQHYAQNAEQLHALLPNVLGRIRIVDANGSENEVAERVMNHLEQGYGLQRPVIEYTLFRNLRSFINDIAKQPGRSFGREEFEIELRCIWPHMVPIKAPPLLVNDHVRRPYLAANFTESWTGVAIEVVGISGSGKTQLAAEVIERSQLIHPDRIALYAEVRSGTSLRDCLVGAAFHLRRRGLSEPFAVSVQPDLTHEGALTALAKTLSEASCQCLLLLDLVEGREPSSFAHDLATFIRALPTNGLRLIVFGQERVFRELTSLEQTQRGVRSVDAPGLSFEEFVTLVEFFHEEPDRALLYRLYQQMTAGRAAGLNVSLAQALARTQTTEEMTAIARRPTEDRLGYAERTRFTRLSHSARSAAEKLTCFALPFSWKVAESVFPANNIRLAIRELTDLGLLRRHDDETFEMHETVRAGLETLIAPQARQNAHEDLATWYRDQGMREAAIFHLEQAGLSHEAQILAREVFLTGESWAALWPYVARNRLVSADEVVSVIARPEQVDGAYLLHDIFRELEGSAESLITIIHEQSGRIFSEPQWALHILEAILEVEPSHLDELIQLEIEAAPSAEARADALTWLSIAARRRVGPIDSATLALFDRQSETIQMSLLRLLMHGGRAALQHAIHYLWTHPQLLETEHGYVRSGFGLELRSDDDVANLLAVVPMVSPANMIRTRGPLFGPLGGLIWHARKALQSQCVDVLHAQTLDSNALINAIRILIYLGEPIILDLCEELRGRDDDAGTLASLVPAVVPGLVDWHPYGELVLDQTAAFSDRGQALITLAWSGSQLDELLGRLQAVEEADWHRWTPILRTIASVTPFPAAIPVLEEALASENDQVDALLPSIITRQGQQPGFNVTCTLLRAMAHRNSMVRLSALTALVRRRDNAALPHLIDLYRQEGNAKIQALLATSILASGSDSTTDLNSHTGTSATDLWWCVLVHRSRDLSAAERLISIATDRSQLWQIRRAAIAAAGRLPYDAALAHIESSVMMERSPLALDRNRDLIAHSAVTQIISEAAIGLRQFYQNDRAGFVSCFEPYFENFWTVTFDQTGLPSGASAAGWLYDVLVNEYGTESARLEQMINALHVPLLQGAILRSLRLCGRQDRIDANFEAAGHVWIAVRALLERLKLPERGPALRQRLHDLAAGAAWSDDRVVIDVINQLGTSPVSNMPSGQSPNPVPSPPPTCSPLTFQTVARLLSGAEAESLPDGVLVLETLVVDECETLISLADPRNDPERGETIFVPVVAFTPEGHQVSQRQTTYRGRSVQERLRPAIAAANRFGLHTPWHEEILKGPLGETYASDFLACLAATGDSTRFYDALTGAEGMLMPKLCQKAYELSSLLEIDNRLIPALTRHISVGGDDLFEGLCTLAKCIDVPEVDPVLEGLLHRWAQRFDIQSDRALNDGAFHLWRGFARLSEHPRFDTIPSWPQQLESVLKTPMAYYHAQSIVRVLERDSGSYILIESRLFKEENWIHNRQDEVERLDLAAEALFGRFQDTSIH